MIYFLFFTILITFFDPIQPQDMNYKNGWTYFQIAMWILSCIGLLYAIHIEI